MEKLILRTKSYDAGSKLTVAPSDFEIYTNVSGSGFLLGLWTGEICLLRENFEISSRCGEYIEKDCNADEIKEFSAKVNQMVINDICNYYQGGNYYDELPSHRHSFFDFEYYADRWKNHLEDLVFDNCVEKMKKNENKEA